MFGEKSNMKEQLSSLTAYEPGLTVDQIKQKYDIPELYKMASNENLHGPSPFVKAEISKVLDLLHFYPDSGVPTLKKYLSKHWDIQSDRIIVGAGLDEIILILSRAKLTPETEIITSEMTFGQYKHNAVVEGAIVKEIPLNEGEIDLKGHLNQISKKTSLIWICNPNNPTGTYLTHSELKHFLEKVPENITVVLDEAYAEFVTAKDFPNFKNLLEAHDNLCLLRTFSKAYGLAGLRIGYAIVPEKYIQSLNVIRPPFNVSRISEVAAISAFKDQEYLDNIVKINQKEREKFLNLNIAARIYPSQTNFIFIKTDKSGELFKSLLFGGVISREFPNGVRISIGLPHMNDLAVNLLKEFKF